MDNETKTVAYFLGGILGIALLALVGLMGMIWTELDKNDRCVQLINNPSLDVQKHEDIIQKFCR